MCWVEPTVAESRRTFLRDNRETSILLVTGREPCSQLFINSPNSHLKIDFSKKISQANIDLHPSCSSVFFICTVLFPSGRREAISFKKYLTQLNWQSFFNTFFSFENSIRILFLIKISECIVGRIN